jgi:hypothetical protein
MTDKPKKLSNTARALLTAAAMRNDHLIALPKLPVAAARQVVRSLLNAGFSEEVPGPICGPIYAWRTGKDGGVLALRVTALGIARISEGNGDPTVAASIVNAAERPAEDIAVQAGGSALIATPSAIDPLADANRVGEHAQEGQGGVNAPGPVLSPEAASKPAGPAKRTDGLSDGLRRPCSTPGKGWLRSPELMPPKSSAPSPPFAPRWQQAHRRTNRPIARFRDRT